jgi:Domain of unknown function (DUF397)
VADIDFHEADFRSSSFCGTGGCIEVAVLADGRVAVRDGKDRDLSVQVYSAAEWRAFVAGVKNGEFDC